MKQSEWAPGVLEQFHEQAADLYEFQTCQRGDGSLYGTGGTCRKGTPVDPPDTDAAKGHGAANKKFMSSLSGSLPDNTETSVEDGEVVMRTETAKGTKLKITFSLSEGYNFSVNGGWDAGSVTDRREQVAVALAVKKNWNAVTKSMPAGSVLKTRAWAGDGLEQYNSRVKAYERMGFGKPKSLGGEMYAKKDKNGNLKPATALPYRKNQKKEDAVFFAEMSEDQSTENWRQAIFGNKKEKKK